MSLLLALVAALGQDGREIGRGWTLYRSDTDCAVVRSYERGTMFRVGYAAGTNSALISIADPAFKSIQDDKAYKLKLYFLTDGRMDDAWGTVDARGFRTEKFNGFSIRLNGTDLLRDLEKHKLLGLFRDDVVVSSLELDGSARAVAQLRACADQVQRANPSDPFAD